jgi:hypothetical protein
VAGHRERCGQLGADRSGGRAVGSEASSRASRASILASTFGAPQRALVAAIGPDPAEQGFELARH